MRFCLLFWLACLGDAADSGIPNVNLVHTPWWILAGVTPQGPSIDMGSYNLTSFSKTQQEQFGVNQHGQIVKWSRFTTATAALAPCAEPVTVQHGLNEAQMMRLLGHALDVAWRRAQLEDPQLRMWMEKRSSCQRGCMVKVIGVSLKTLWAVGELLTSAGRGAFAKALESAMRACYPGFRTLNVDSVIEKVATYVGLELRRTHPDMASKSGFAPSRSLQSDIEPCLTHADESRQSFVERMESSVQSALEEARRRSWHLLEHDARPCQQSCQKSVLRQTVHTLWDSGLLSLGNSDALALTALQGAMAACLPNLPEKEAAELAGEALMRFQATASQAQLPGLYGDCTRQRRCSGHSVQCYAQNHFYAQCLRSCPENWDCSSPLVT